MLEGLVPVYVWTTLIIITMFIGIPQIWKEENSWYIAIIKFWFILLPGMGAITGIFIFFLGPIHAILGLFMMKYVWVTILYIYMGIVLFTIQKINARYDNILKRI